MGGERVSLQIEIDASGTVTGKRQVVRSLDEIKSKAGELDGATKRVESSLGGMAARLATLAIPVALIAGLRSAVSAAAESEKVMAQVEAAVRSTGGAAGFTAGELAVMSRELSKLVGISDDAILGAQSILLAFKSIRGDTFREATVAALDLSARLGIDLKSAALQVGKALEDPLEGISALSRSGVKFSADQEKVIKKLVETGQAAKAQRVILDELAVKFGGAAAAARDTFAGSIAAARIEIGKLMERLGERLIPVLRSITEWVAANADRFTELAGTIGDTLVRNLDILVTLFKVLVAIQAVSWLQKVASAATELANKIAAVGSASAISAGPLTALLAIIVAVAEGLRIAAARMQQDIDQMVVSMNKLGEGMQVFLKIKRELAAQNGTGPVEISQKEADAIKHLIAETERQIREIEKAKADALKAAGSIVNASADSIQGRNLAAHLATFDAKINQLQGTLTNYYGALENVTVATEDLVKPTADLPPLLDESDKKLKALKASLRALQDELNPGSAAVRKMFENLDTLKEALASNLITQGQYLQLLSQLAPPLDAAAEAAFDYATGLFKVASAQERLNAEIAKTPLHIPDNTGGTELGSKTSDLNKDLEQAATNFSQNLEQGIKASFAAGLVDFANGGDDVLKRFGQNLTQVLLNAVAEWLSAALVAIAKQAAAAKGIQAASGGGGSGGAGGLGSLFGGGGGMSSGAASGLIFAAVVAGMIAAFKHQSDRHNAVQFGSEVGVNVTGGVVTADWTGRLNETASAATDAISELMHGLQDSTGALIEGVQWASIQLRNDKEEFIVSVGNEVLGRFQSLQEAILAAAKKMFTDGATGLDPIFKSMIDNFHGDDPSKLLESLSAVRSIMDEVGGLSDIEIALRDLPAQVGALTDQLVGMGIGLDEAKRIAGEWNIAQRQSIRDQITNHQQTVAEQREQFERERAMFNAGLELDKMKIASEISRLEGLAAAQSAQQQLDIAEITMHEASINNTRNYLLAKNDLLDFETEIAIGHLNLMQDINNVALGNLNAQIDVLKGIFADLSKIKPIGANEFHPNTGGGHAGGSSGPTPEERLATIRDEIDSFSRSLESGFAPQLADIIEKFDDWRTRLEELGQTVEGLDALMERAVRALIDSAIDAIGGPMQSLRNEFRALADAMDFLREQFEAGAISAEEYGRVIAEASQQAVLRLGDLAAGILEEMGHSEAAARLRYELEQIEFRLKVAQFAFLVDQYETLGYISKEMAAQARALIEAANGFEFPEFTWEDPNAQQGSGHSQAWDQHQAELERRREERERRLESALDRLRGALERYEDFQRSLEIGPLSGATVQQQNESARSEYEQLLARARAGDLDAIDQLPDAARQFLDLAGQLYDPSSSGYQQILEMVRAQMLGIQGGIEGVLGAADAHTSPEERELKNISEILAEMRDLWRINAGWDPGATILPFPTPGVRPGTGGGAGTAGDWWRDEQGHIHPPPRPGAIGGSVSKPKIGPNGAWVVSDPETQSALRAMERRLASIEQKSGKQNDLTQDATLSAKRQAMKRPASSLKGYPGGAPTLNRRAS